MVQSVPPPTDRLRCSLGRRSGTAASAATSRCRSGSPQGAPRPPASRRRAGAPPRARSALVSFSASPLTEWDACARSRGSRRTSPAAFARLLTPWGVRPILSVQHADTSQAGPLIALRAKGDLALGRSISSLSAAVRCSCRHFTDGRARALPRPAGRTRDIALPLRGGTSARTGVIPAAYMRANSRNR